MQFFVTEGIRIMLDGSRAVRDWMNSRGFKLKYKEVNADHGGMVPLVLPDTLISLMNAELLSGQIILREQRSRKDCLFIDSKHFLRITVPNLSANSDIRVIISNISGRKVLTKNQFTSREASVAGMLPAGTYTATIILLCTGTVPHL